MVATASRYRFDAKFSPMSKNCYRLITKSLRSTGCHCDQFNDDSKTSFIYGSATDDISLFIFLFLLLLGDAFLKSLRLRRFKTDQYENLGTIVLQVNTHRFIWGAAPKFLGGPNLQPTTDVLQAMLGVGDGRQRGTCPPPRPKKSGKIFFWKLLCKIRAFFGQKSYKISDFY